MDYVNIPAEKFQFADKDGRIGDKKFSTKQMSFTKDVFRRFCKNKSSVVAAIIIAVLILFAIVVPIIGATGYTENLRDTTYLQYKQLLPKNKLFAPLGIWDGCSDKTINQDTYNYWRALEAETGDKVFHKVYREGYVAENSISKTLYYDVKMDSYTSNGMTYLSLTEAEYLDIQKWQNENDIQVIYPAVDTLAEDDKGNLLIPKQHASDANIYYASTRTGAPKYINGELQTVYLTSGRDDMYDSKRIEGDDGSYHYAEVGGPSNSKTYKVRVYRQTYFQYRYGFEPSFLLGTTELGQDILTRLASAARFSLVLAICISAVNLFIGAIIGALEGYYGGAFDLIMERIIDILGGVPSMVVMALFQLHLASKIGPVLSMAFAFILTGWIGMSARTRMQFYRFKRQEYVLSARTLGASDARLMFKHIFPNAMGTLITGSVLAIPGVIFSESSLTYLRIVNLNSSTMTSVGTMLANGRNNFTTYPHIILFPALFLALLEVSFNLFGNGLRDAFNPSLKGVED